MKSPQISTIIVAALLAALAYAIHTFLKTPEALAIFVFIIAFVAPLIGWESSSTSESETEELKTLYVGNLPYRANETAVRELFSDYGSVHSVRLMKDKHTGKRRGFGFVEMSATDLNDAISALNDSEFQQRTLKVREAKERPE